MQLRIASPVRHGVVASLPRARAARGNRLVVRSNLVDDLINKVSVAVKNSPLNQGKLALAISQVNCRRCWHRCRRHRRRTRRSCAARLLLSVPARPGRPFAQQHTNDYVGKGAGLCASLL